MKRFLGSRFPLLLILLGGTALRLFRLGADSLWYDETVSTYLAGSPLLELIRHTAGDIHPPLYYALLRGWLLLMGYGSGRADPAGIGLEFSAAFFSLFFGVALIALAYALARRVADRRVALVAAAAVAVSPYNVWYSQEVRMYTLGAALGAVVVYALLRAVQASDGLPGSPPGAKASGLRSGSLLKQADNPRTPNHRRMPQYRNPNLVDRLRAGCRGGHVHALLLRVPAHSRESVGVVAGDDEGRRTKDEESGTHHASRITHQAVVPRQPARIRPLSALAADRDPAGDRPAGAAVAHPASAAGRGDRELERAGARPVGADLALAGARADRWGSISSA